MWSFRSGAVLLSKEPRQADRAPSAGRQFRRAATMEWMRTMKGFCLVGVCIMSAMFWAATAAAAVETIF